MKVCHTRRCGPNAFAAPPTEADRLAALREAIADLDDAEMRTALLAAITAEGLRVRRNEPANAR